MTVIMLLPSTAVLIFLVIRVLFIDIIYPSFIYSICLPNNVCNKLKNKIPNVLIKLTVILALTDFLLELFKTKYNVNIL